MHRRLAYASVMLLALLCFSLIVPVFAQTVTPTPGAMATVTTGQLNVRSMPSPDAVIVTKIDHGATYPIIGRNSTGKWWQLNINGVVGWVNGKYIEATNTDAVPITFVDLTHTEIAPTPTVLTTEEATATVTMTPEATESICSLDALFFDNTEADLCATGPAGSSAATTQQFENGSMIYLANTGNIYVLSNRGVILVPSTIYDNLSTPEPLTPPEGRLVPDEGFGRIWANISGVRADLGWATSSVLTYTAAVQPAGFTSSGEKVLMIQLRSGSIVAVDTDASMWYTVTSG